MSREIKFRAYQDNKMYYQGKSGVYGTKHFFDTLYEDCELMQFTGLTDKNGKEIYEGDICKRHINKDDRFNLGFEFYDYWLIEWLDKTAGFTTTCIAKNNENGDYLLAENGEEIILE